MINVQEKQNKDQRWTKNILKDINPKLFTYRQLKLHKVHT